MHNISSTILPLPLHFAPVQVHGLVVDEASLTGESDPVKKGPRPKLEPWVRSGTQVRRFWRQRQRQR